jgi:cytochrome c553
MKKLMFSLLLGFGVANGAVAVESKGAIEGNAANGKAKSAMCSACHGADGNAFMPTYPKLAGQSASYIAKQLADFKEGVVSGGKKGRVDPVMGSMTMALSKQDMADLGAYYAAQKSTPGDGADNKVGKKLYLGGDAKRGITACIACHSVDGQGMAKAGFPAIASQDMAYLAGQLEKFRSGVRSNDNNSVMRNIAIKLEDGDIAALAQYMSSMK